MDQTIEQTYNRSAKTIGGITGFSRNPSAYYRWSTIRHLKAAFADFTFSQAGIGKEEYSIHSARKSVITQEERDIRRLQNTINDCLNPFEIEDTNLLYCISCGVPVPDEITKDLLLA